MKCVHCNAKFEPKRKTAQFCSPKCRVYAKRGVIGKVDVLPELVESKIVTTATTSKEITNMVFSSEPYEAKNYDFCSHDAVKGFCKKGCK